MRRCEVGWEVGRFKRVTVPHDDERIEYTIFTFFFYTFRAGSDLHITICNSKYRLAII